MFAMLTMRISPLQLATKPLARRSNEEWGQSSSRKNNYQKYLVHDSEILFQSNLSVQDQ